MMKRVLMGAILMSATAFGQGAGMKQYKNLAGGDWVAVTSPVQIAAGKMNISGGTSTNQTLVGATVADKLSFNTAFTGALVAGQIAWDPDWQTFRAGLPDGVTGQFFQESQIYAKNASGQVVTNGMAVMQSDAVGNSSKLEFVLAQASVGTRSSMMLGVATHDIAAGAFGKITWFGNVNEIDTTGALYGESGWTNNMPVYVSTNKPGFLTRYAPEAPYPRISAGAVGNAHANAGNIFVRPTWGLSMTDLDDVNGTPLTATGQIPVYDSARGVFDFNRNVNEFLLSSSFNAWLSTNTYVQTELDQTALAALAAYAATSRTERLYAPGSFNEWRDGSGKVWRVTSSSNWVCNIPSAPPAFTVPGLSFPFVGVFTYSANDYTLTVTEGSDVYDFTLVSGLGDYYEVLDVDVTGSETENPPMTDIELLSTHELPNAHLVLTGQVVTQQVDTVALVSHLPGIVYSNSVSALTIYTNASGAATSWWQVASGVTNSGKFASGMPGAITNGQTGPLTLGQMQMIANGNVGLGGEPITSAGWPLTVTGSSRFNGWVYVGGMILTESYVYNAGGYAFKTWNGDLIDAVSWTSAGNVSMPNGNLTVAKTNTAAAVRTQSSYLLPHLGTNTTISLIFTNGTLQAWEIAP